MTIYDGLIEMREAGMNSTSVVFCKYDEFIVPDSAYYEVNIFAMTFRDHSCLCHA